VKQLMNIKKAKKYLPNPEPNWGPKGRAIGNYQGTQSAAEAKKEKEDKE
jgi:hypothetical protein